MEPKKKEPKQSTKARVTQRKPRERNHQEAMLDDPDPGMTQKQNQNQERDDPLAA